MLSIETHVKAVIQIRVISSFLTTVCAAYNTGRHPGHLDSCDSDFGRDSVMRNTLIAMFPDAFTSLRRITI